MKPRALVALAGLTAVLLVVASGTAEGRSRLRIGLVFQDTAVTGAYQQGAFAGLQRAVKELGVEAKTVVPGPRQNSYVPSFSYLARQKCDPPTQSGRCARNHDDLLVAPHSRQGLSSPCASLETRRDSTSVR
jgi:basic membrane lipoprotein Med (substrate-binding protein (PBP1-ABC) superfamily)